MKTQYFFTLIIVLTAFGSIEQLYGKDKGKCHAVLVADLDAENLEQSVERDLERMQSQVRRICKYAQLRAKEKVFMGQKKDPERLRSYLEKLNVAADDVLLFYFSGHGYRTEENGISAWPNISFQIADAGVRFDEIVTLLSRKQARLIIIIADCCNNRLPLVQRPEKMVALKPKNLTDSATYQTQRQEVYKKLFRHSHGMLVVTSALPDEYAYAEDEGGSLFTKIFTTWLERSLYQENVCWNAWMDETEKLLVTMTEAENLKQHPFIYNAIVE
jgi:hypothetical protein